MHEPGAVRPIQVVEVMGQRAQRPKKRELGIRIVPPGNHSGTLHPAQRVAEGESKNIQRITFEPRDLPRSFQDELMQIIIAKKAGIEGSGHEQQTCADDDGGRSRPFQR